MGPPSGGSFMPLGAHRPPMELVDFDIAVFDMDGTLYTTGDSVLPAIMETFAELRLPLPDVTQVRGLIGMPDVHYHAWLRERAPGHEDVIVEAVTTREAELVQERGALYPRAREMLQELRRLGCRTALLTNAGREYAHMVLTRFEMWDLFDDVSWHDGGGAGKEERLAMVVEKLGGGEAVMVGDRFYDIEAAKAVGCLAVGITHGYGEEEVSDADVIIDSLWQLVEMKLRAVARAREGNGD